MVESVRERKGENRSGRGITEEEPVKKAPGVKSCKQRGSGSFQKAPKDSVEPARKEGERSRWQELTAGVARGRTHGGCTPRLFNRKTLCLCGEKKKD